MQSQLETTVLSENEDRSTSTTVVKSNASRWSKLSINSTSLPARDLIDMLMARGCSLRAGRGGI